MTSQQIVLITGCSSGIGCQVAKNFASDEQRRYKVWATVKALDEKEELEREAGSLLNETLFIKELDLTKPQNIEDAVRQILDEDGRVDILINNAVNTVFGPLEAIPMDRGRNVFEVNFFGHARLMQLIIPSMKSRKYGRIINISSASTLLASPFTDYYVASKQALEGVSLCTAPTLRAFNVWVSIVQVTSVNTKNAMDLLVNGKNENYVINDNLDEVTKKMLDKWLNFLKLSMSGDHVRTPQETAQFIRSVAEEEKPKGRYQSAPDGQILAAEHYCDPSGEAVLQMNNGIITNGRIST